MTNTSELLINVVTADKPKVLKSERQPATARRLGPKGKWTGMNALPSFTADDEPPANRQGLSCSGSHAERGKPDSLRRKPVSEP